MRLSLMGINKGQNFKRLQSSMATHARIDPRGEEWREGGHRLRCARETRSLIARPENWTQGVHSRNEAGSEEESFSPNACQWCAIAALQRAYLEISRDCSEFPPMNPVYDEAYDILTEVVGGDLESWNDDENTTHDKVVRAFDEAV